MDSKLELEFSSDNLLKMLEYCTTSIKNNSLTLTEQKRVWDALTWDKNDPECKRMIQYLFMGMWFDQCANNVSQSESKTGFSN